MKSVCIYFQIHQPFRLRTYRFFDIGADHYYYDDYQNRHIIQRVAEKCYLPANDMFLEMIKHFGKKFRIAFSISGSALEQLQLYAPEVISSFKRLADTGCVEFLAETYSHSLASLKNKEEFERQVKMHSGEIERLFGYKTKAFRNTELIFSDDIGQMVSDMGFDTILAEGAKHVLGWKSPNYVYHSSQTPRLKVLLRNFRLSDDIAFRFSNQSWADWPLDADKFIHWLEVTDPDQKVINLFMDYETIGEHQWAETGIFDFIRSLINEIILHKDFQMNTPSQVTKLYQSAGGIQVPYPNSWADEERDITAWLGNELQDNASGKLYQLAECMKNCTDEDLQNDWLRLQTSDHFYYMCTKWFSDGEVHKYFNPYASPYEAFINYMNVLSDFELRCKSLGRIENESIESAMDSNVLQTIKRNKKIHGDESLLIARIDILTVARIKVLLKDVEPRLLAHAIQNLSMDFRNKIFKSLGIRMEKSINQELEAKKPSKTDVKIAVKYVLEKLTGEK
ncbi:MAG: FliG C-terminal domain-containing protein [Bacteroidales bacterium]|nr:FliG C-terminal domain-containing protein [Bacteroidales bacterium]